MATDRIRGEAAERPLHFHSSREERLARVGAPTERGQRRAGVFRRNRTLLVVFVDILLVLLLGVLLARLLYSQTPKARLEGYAVSLRALAYGEVVYATLTVSREGRFRGEEAADGRIYVRLALSRDASDAEAQFLSAQLPAASAPGAAAGGELVLRETLAASGNTAGTLYAQVRIGKAVRLLSCGL